jgi:hypothetical protein
MIQRRFDRERDRPADRDPVGAGVGLALDGSGASDMGERSYGPTAGKNGHTSYIATRRTFLTHPVATVDGMAEDQPAKVTLGHLLRADRMCARRLKLEHGNTKANFSSNGRWRVSNRVTEEVRLSHTELAAPTADRFAGTADELTPEQRSIYELATRWYVTLFTRPARVVDEDRWGTDLPGDLRLVGQGGLALTDADGEPEIRLLSFASRVPASASPDSPGVRFALLRREGWLRGGSVRVAVADLVHGTYEEEIVDTTAVMPEITQWLDERIDVIRSRVANPVARSSLECAWCPYIAGCDAHR